MAHPESTPFDDSYSVVSVLIPPHSRVLDVGCGDGTFARQLASRGCEVVGIEIDKEKADSAGEWCERVIVGDLEDLDFDLELGGIRFSIVCCLDVLEHLKDPSAVLSRLVDALAPGGRIVLSIPNVTHSAVRLQLLRGEFKYTTNGLLDRTHLRFFDRQELERLIADADLHVSDRLYVRRGIDETEIDIDIEKVAPEIRSAATAGPDADVYQFVWAVSPAHLRSDTIGAEALWHELELARSQLGQSRAGVTRVESLCAEQLEELQRLTLAVDAATAEADALRSKADEYRWRLDHAERAAQHRELIALQARDALAAEEVRVRELQDNLALREVEMAQLRDELASLRARLVLGIAESVGRRLKRYPLLWRAAHFAIRRVGG